MHGGGGGVRRIAVLKRHGSEGIHIGKKHITYVSSSSSLMHQHLFFVPSFCFTLNSLLKIVSFCHSSTTVIDFGWYDIRTYIRKYMDQTKLSLGDFLERKKEIFNHNYFDYHPITHANRERESRFHLFGNIFFVLSFAHYKNAHINRIGPKNFTSFRSTYHLHLAQVSPLPPTFDYTHPSKCKRSANYSVVIECLTVSLIKCLCEAKKRK